MVNKDSNDHVHFSRVKLSTYDIKTFHHNYTKFKSFTPQEKIASSQPRKTYCVSITGPEPCVATANQQTQNKERRYVRICSMLNYSYTKSFFSYIATFLGNAL